MKLSVLLPTRNGGPFLHDCVASVLRQEDTDLELVVADNANQDETADVLYSFRSDRRMVVIRHAEPLPVTDNWRSALAASTGDYMLMIGDDDYLLPSYSSRIRRLIEQHDYPDCVTYNAYSYVFPSAIAGLDTSHYGDPHFSFGPDFVPYQMLGSELQRSIVRDMFCFRPRLPLNMQATLVSRRAVDRLAGDVFRPPFPDHYALNALLLTADRWLYAPDKLLVIGVSLKSFGHFVYSNQQDDGLEYLGISSKLDDRLPGNELLTAMYSWLLLLKRNFPAELQDVEVSRADYVARQLWDWYVQWRFGSLTARAVLDRLRLLSWQDWTGVLALAPDWEILQKVVRRGRLRGDRVQHIWYGLKPLPGVRGIADFAEWLHRADVVC
ncbi:MAG: glycosyltransferase family 2 protein [Actinomycetota bacterium]|nr:glycosyltransferase family 2 protein [Actinomycetota bacterium]